MKIIHERDQCIGCGMCVEHASTFWKISQDGKAMLIGSKENNNIFSKNIQEKDLVSNQNAANDCPVGVIKIEK